MQNNTDLPLISRENQIINHENQILKKNKHSFTDKLKNKIPNIFKHNSYSLYSNLGYQYLDILKDKGITFYHTPFFQISLTEIFNPEWRGSCGFLTYQWLANKILLEDIKTQLHYEISQPYLPHPFILGSNDPRQEDMKNLYKKIDNDRSVFKLDMKILEKKSQAKGVDAFLYYLNKYSDAYGFLKIHKEYVISEERANGHIVGFIRKNEDIAFFDANRGEVALENREAFSSWIKLEASQGALTYLFPQEEETLKKKNSLDYSISKEWKNKASKALIARHRTFIAQKRKNPTKTCSYTMELFYK